MCTTVHYVCMLASYKKVQASNQYAAAMPEPTATAPISVLQRGKPLFQCIDSGIGHTGVLEAVDVTARERIAARRVTQVEWRPRHRLAGTAARPLSSGS